MYCCCPLPKAEMATAKRTKGGGNRGRCIVLMQKKFGNLVTLGRTTGCIHRATLVKTGKVKNLGGVT